MRVVYRCKWTILHPSTVPPPPAHQPTLHIWDVSISGAAEKPWWRPDRANKHDIWRQNAKTRPQRVVPINNLTMRIHRNRLGMILLSNDHWSIEAYDYCYLLRNSIRDTQVPHSALQKQQKTIGTCRLLCNLLSAHGSSCGPFGRFGPHVEHCGQGLSTILQKGAPKKLTKSPINSAGLQLAFIQTQRFESCLHMFHHL